MQEVVVVLFVINEAEGFRIVLHSINRLEIYFLIGEGVYRS